jgi:serine/threonine protein kinase
MTSVPSKNPSELCRSCGQILDISAMLPLSVVACPVCSTSTTVLRHVGPFQLERLLGQGGMGAVYQAYDIGLRRPVALKVLNRSWSQDEKVTAQFEREAAITARVNHPNVVRVYSSGLSHGIFYIAMELVTDGSLEKWMAESGRLPELEVVRAGIQIAQGLLAAQNAGLIHRDIKPANILFAEGRVPKIVDFGLAVHSSEADQKEADAEVWGTPEYIAPESLEFKKEDFRSDIYALGATLWHALTGAPPYRVQSTSIREILKIKQKPVELVRVLPRVNPGTAHALNRALAFHPEDRHPDYPAFIHELKGALRALEAAERRPSTARALDWMRSPAVSASLGGLALISCGFALWRIKSNASSRDFAPHESVVLEETRLVAGLRLMASGRLPEAAATLEKLLRVPQLSPLTGAWCRFSLALMYGIDGQIERRQYLLSTLAVTTLPSQPELARWFQNLPGVASSSRPPAPGSSPGQMALHHLSSAVLELDRQKWGPSQHALDLALEQTPRPDEPEAAALLSFARWIQADLRSLHQIQTRLDAFRKKPAAEAPLREAEAIAQRLTLVLPVRRHLHQALDQARTLAEKTAASRPEPSLGSPSASPATSSPAATAAPSPSGPGGALAPELVETFRKETAELVSQFLFAAAVKKAEEFGAASPAHAAIANARMPLLKVSATFFQWTVREINRGHASFPYPTLRSGAPFPAKPVRADLQNIFLQTDQGSSAEIPWSQIAPAYLLTVANVRLPQVQEPMSRAEILWMAGHFQILAGAREKGLATLKQAADLNANYFEGFKFLFSNP